MNWEQPMLPGLTDRIVLATEAEPAPRLWDQIPNGIVHIAGGQLSIGGRYLRQRCEWCGEKLIDYDLARIAVPIGQPWEPAMWTPGELVWVDGSGSCVYESVHMENGETRLPMNCCVFNPLTQVGM